MSCQLCVVATLLVDAPSSALRVPSSTPVSTEFLLITSMHDTRTPTTQCNLILHAPIIDFKSSVEAQRTSWFDFFSVAFSNPVVPVRMILAVYNVTRANVSCANGTGEALLDCLLVKRCPSENPSPLVGP